MGFDHAEQGRMRGLQERNRQSGWRGERRRRPSRQSAKVRKTMKGDITKLTQQIVLEGRKPAKDIAEAIGKPYSTLLRELNPFDGQAKLGVETLLEIMRVTQNVEPLKLMAESLGFELVGVCAPRAKADRMSVESGTLHVPAFG
jgi:hypothetical protein